MGVSKNMNRLAILGLLACGGAWAQTVGVNIGTTAPGAAFLVDGSPYSSTQIFQWAVGSSHQVYFVQSLEADGSVGNHQYSTLPGVRYAFSSWNVTGQALTGSSPLLTLAVGPGLTDIIGQVTTEVQISLSFTGFTDPNLVCSADALPNDPREGVVMIDSTCYSSPAAVWVPQGLHSFAVASFPGYVFTNWLINNAPVAGPTLSQYPIVMGSTVSAVFVKAKRVRIRSNPPGLSFFVDHHIVQPGAIPSTAYSGDRYCPVIYAQLPISWPVGYVPLCVGDFDFLPGSQHVLGAPVQQSDFVGNSWVFAGFSNGLGQNSIYTADYNTGTVDTFTANFVAAVPAQVITSPAGLTVNVDGLDNSKGSQLLWGEGQTHHLIAPPTQTDATGRPWQFASWSQGGTADQMYTVPTGVLGVRLVANYVPAGKLQVVSVPPGLPFTVDGAPCVTPCVLLDKPTGATVQVVAPPSVVPDAFSRYTFGSWNGGSTATSLQITIGDQTQVFTATYQTFYKLTATSQPANLVNFQFNPPPSSDGFFPGGTRVSVTAFPNNGYTFKSWSGDLSGTDLTASVVMNGPRFAVATLDGFPYVSGVQNAAGPTPANTVGPGSNIAIVGDDLSATTTSSPDGELSQALDDVWVTLNDRLLPLLYISPQFINAQLFSDLPDGEYTLTVHRSGHADASKTFTVRRDSPGLFQSSAAGGAPTVSAAREDGSELTADNPAVPNETISIYGTGFGLYDHPLVDGFPTPDTGDWNLVDPVTVTIGGQTYTPVTARALNGFAGLVVLRVKLTGTLPSGLVDLKVTVNNVDSTTVKLPIQ